MAPSVMIRALMLGATCAFLGAAAPAQAAPGRAVQATQSLVILERAVQAFSLPDQHSTPLAAVSDQRPITGERTALPVVEHRAGTDGRGWIRVMLPGRPNGRTGWIAPVRPKFALTAWRLLVEIARRRVTVYRDGRVARTFRVVVGGRTTPTPLGSFFVEETVRLGQDRIGAPYALALSARSNVFAHFDGGPGQIALHGLGGVGGVPGTATSHGCIRLDRPSISWLAARIGPGVPVTITR
ncbi:MAG: hypothetical protein NVSMB25_24690 [Thermoleophilaceae bacterium]